MTPIYRTTSLRWRGRILLLSIVFLAACASPTPYAPATNGEGYSERQVEENRYRVSFTGNSVTPRETVEAYLLYRAAEITLQTGNDYFRVAEQDLEPKTRYHSSVSGFSGFGYRTFDHRRSLGFGGFASGSSWPITSYEAVANIVVLSGQKPAEDVQAYSARDVIEKLGSTVQRPGAVAAPRDSKPLF